MFLCDQDIHCAINKEELRITPFDSGSIRPGSICLHLSSEFISLETGPEEVVDVFSSHTYPSENRIIIKEAEGVVIPPSGFLLGCTVEKIGMSNSLLGMLSNISGLARLGLNVLFSTHVAPGFGKEQPKSIVLEIFNASNNPIRVYPGMRICHLIFGRLAQESSMGYDQVFPNKYKGTTITGSEFYKGT